MSSDSTPHSALPKRPGPPPGPAPLLARLLRRPWPPVDVLVVKTRDCMLCDEALAILRRQKRRLGLEVRVCDITGVDRLLRVYGEEVPVVFVHGKKRFMGRVNTALLKRAVEAART